MYDVGKLQTVFQCCHCHASCCTFSLVFLLVNFCSLQLFSFLFIISNHYWLITNWKRIINESWSDILDISKSLSVELAATIVKLQGTGHVHWHLSNELGRRFLDTVENPLRGCSSLTRLVWISLDQTYKKNMSNKLHICIQLLDQSGCQQQDILRLICPISSDLPHPLYPPISPSSLSFSCLFFLSSSHSALCPLSTLLRPLPYLSPTLPSSLYPP